MTVYLRTEFSLVKRILAKIGSCRSRTQRKAEKKFTKRIYRLSRRKFRFYQILKPREDRTFWENGGIFLNKFRKINCRNGKKWNFIPEIMIAVNETYSYLFRRKETKNCGNCYVCTAKILKPILLVQKDKF